MGNTIQTARALGGILGAIDQIARKNAGNCPRCGKPRDDVRVQTHGKLRSFSHNWFHTE